MLNPFFLQGSKGEQNLVQDLINEQLKIYGVEVYYLPREYVTEKTIIKEVIQSSFSYAYPIEAYVNTYDGYANQGTLLSKFGIQELDDLVVTISKDRYENYIVPLIRDLPNIKLPDRPKEGDLIYFPLGDRLFEIKYVEHETNFYQLQKNYTYELRCELFRYEDEVIDTGIENIDDNIENAGHIRTLNMVGVGSTASAIVTNIVNGGVRLVTITNRGSGYTSAPIVAFSSAPFGGITATGIATMIGGLVDICAPEPELLRVQSVQLTNPGLGYTVAPMISFTGGDGNGATATATIADGIVGIISITSAGSGYSAKPTITFNGYAQKQAKAEAILTNGTISEIRLLDSGQGYLQPPTITISNPVLVGVGTYKPNEVVVGSASSFSARVKSWDAVNNILEVSNLSGEFIPGEILTGQTSNASYSILIPYTDNLANPEDIQNQQDFISKDAFAQNKNIEDEAKLILDFSESNPFGMP